jgi:carbon-monoxide dehydrogenase medium subunit
VYPAAFEYFAPRTLDEALDLLARHGDDAKILAGGQSLLPMMKLRIASPRYLIDINRIDGLDGLRLDGDRLVIGALCRHADLLASPIVREHFPIMIDAASQTADVQVRNRGTLAGSLAHADPAGDWPAALMALDTTVTIAGPDGPRRLPLADFIVDAYTTQMGPGDMITEVSVAVPPRASAGAYRKFERRAGDFAVASVGVQLTAAESSRFQNVAISLGAVGAMPIRVPDAEALLRSKVLTADLVSAATELVRTAADPFADTRGSVEYKRHLVGVLFERTVSMALGRAG